MMQRALYIKEQTQATCLHQLLCGHLKLEGLCHRIRSETTFVQQHFQDLFFAQLWFLGRQFDHSLCLRPPESTLACGGYTKVKQSKTISQQVSRR